MPITGFWTRLDNCRGQVGLAWTFPNSGVLRTICPAAPKYFGGNKINCNPVYLYNVLGPHQKQILAARP